MEQVVTRLLELLMSERSHSVVVLICLAAVLAPPMRVLTPRFKARRFRLVIEYDVVDKK